MVVPLTLLLVLIPPPMAFRVLGQQVMAYPPQPLMFFRYLVELTLSNTILFFYLDRPDFPILATIILFVLQEENFRTKYFELL